MSSSENEMTCKTSAVKTSIEQLASCLIIRKVNQRQEAPTNVVSGEGKMYAVLHPHPREQRGSFRMFNYKKEHKSYVF